MRKIALWLAGLLFAMGTAAVHAQDLNRKLPIDPEVRIGRLENGLVYYLRQNAKPENRVMMQLVVNAGSICEAEDQRGIAHFCEHMMFNGTAHFPKNELIDFLQNTGVRFGGDINAYTTFDETVYLLEIPTDKEGLLEKGYQVLEDWAHQATLDSQAIDGERGVIIEEWRKGLGADDRLRKQTLPVLLNNSRYADRLPIGTIDNLRTFKPESLRRFYRDFYRPDLQAVIVVGDIDLNEAEAQIKRRFGALQNPADAPARPSVTVPDNREPLVVVATDQEATNNTVVVFFKQPYRPIETVGDFRNDLIRDLVAEMFNTRLNETVQEADAPFIHAGQGYGPLVRQVYVNQFYALAKEGRTAEALGSLLAECYRAVRHGFLENELERARQSLLTNYEIDASEADKTPSSRLATRYVSNFLNQSPIISSADCYKLAKRLLPGISVEEVTAAARAGVTEHNMVIALTASDKTGSAIPTEAELLAIYTAAKNDTTLAPYEDRFSDEPLVNLPARAAAGAEIIGEDTHGITTVRLSNGLIVQLKPTTFKNDEILLGAYNLGGSSLVDLPDLMSATMAGAIQAQSGLGRFDPTELNKKLQGHTVHYQTKIDDLRALIQGSSSVKDLELLLQINYLTFTAPRKDRRACRSLVSKLKTRYKLLKSSPNYVFSDSLLRVASNHDPRYNFLLGEAQLDQIDADRAYDIFREQFGNAGGFHFYLVGSFKIDEALLSLLETYLGALPTRAEERQWRDISVPFPTVKTEFELAMGADEQSMVGLVFTMPYSWDLPTRQSLSFFSELMEIKLLEKIREEMGGVYSPAVRIELERYPKTEASFIVLFGCQPQRTDEITEAVLQQIRLLIKEGPGETDLNKVKETHKRSFEKNLTNNAFWLSMMMQADYIGTDLDGLTKDIQFQRIDNLKAKTIQKTLKKYLNPDVYVRGVLKPAPEDAE